MDKSEKAQHGVGPGLEFGRDRPRPDDCWDRAEWKVENLEQRELYKADITFLFPLGGALPTPTPVGHKVTSIGSGTSTVLLDKHHQYEDSYLVVYFNGTNCESVNGTDSGSVTEDSGIVWRYVNDDLRGNLVIPWYRDPHGPHPYMNVYVGAQSRGFTFKWSVDNLGNFYVNSWRDYLDFFHATFMSLSYNMTGEGLHESPVSRESYLDLEVDRLYATPNSTVALWITAVRNGTPFSGPINLTVRLGGIPIENVTVFTDDEGCTELELRMPEWREIEEFSNGSLDSIMVDIVAGQGNLTDTETVILVLRSAIVGNLFGVDLDLEYGTQQTGGPFGGEVSYLDARILDRASGAAPYEIDPLIQIAGILDSDYSLIVEASNEDTGEEFDRELAVGAFVLKVPPGNYSLKVVLRYPNGVMATEPVDVFVGSDTVVQQDIDVPFALVLRTLRLMDEVREWKIRDTDVYEMVLGALKASTGASALFSALRGMDLSEALRDVYDSIFEDGYSISGPGDFARVMEVYMSEHSGDVESLAEAVSTIVGSLDLGPAQAILPEPSSLPRYDPKSMRNSSESPYYRLAKLDLFLAYLANRRWHLINEIKALSRTVAVRLSVELTKNFRMFQAPFGPMKYLSPARWLRLKVPQILMLSLMGLDLSIGYSRDLTLSFLRAVGERVNLDRAALIVGYFKLVRFAFSYLLGEFRKDLNFEVLFHMVSQAIAFATLQIYLARLNGYLRALPEALSGDLGHSIANARIMDENTNDLEMLMDAVSKPLLVSNNLIRMVSGVMDVAQAAKVFSEKRYLSSGREVMRILRTEVGSTQIVSLARATEAEARLALSPTLIRVFGSDFWSSLLRALKTYGGYLFTLISTMLFLEVTGFLPIMGACSALAIANSSLQPEEISGTEVLKFTSGTPTGINSANKPGSTIHDYISARKRAAEAALSGNPEAEQILQYLRDAFEQYSEAYADYALHPWMSDSELVTAQRALNAVIEDASRLTVGGTSGYMVLMDPFPSLSTDGNVTIYVSPVGDHPERVRIKVMPHDLEYDGPRGEIVLREGYLNFTFPEGDYAVRIVLEDETGITWSTSVTVTRPIVGLRRASLDGVQVYYLIPADFSLRGSTLEYSGGVNLFFALSDQKLSFSGNITMFREMQLENGKYLYSALILNGRALPGSGGPGGGQPTQGSLSRFLIPAAGAVAGIGTLAYLLKKK